MSTRSIIAALTVSVPLVVVASAALAGNQKQTTAVSGSGIDLATDAIVHSEESTPTGMVRRLTEMVKLTGDLQGYVLYQATQEFDFVDNTLVVTGTNVFSGTIAGSDPVVLRSDESRFQVDLATGAETGRVHLTRSNDAPDKGSWYECDLAVVGTGLSAEGNSMFDYSGECTHRGA